MARVEDAGAIAEVHVASWRGAYEGLLSVSLLAAHTVERRAAVWRAELAKSNQMTWLALDAGSVVGFASVGRARDPDLRGQVGELYAIYVSPPAWDQAVGHVRPEKAVSQLGSKYRDAVLWVLDSNARARRFYKRHGWLPGGTVKQEQLGEATTDRTAASRR